MRISLKGFLKTALKTGIRLHFIPASVILWFLLSLPANADPVLMQAGLTTGNFWLVLFSGLLIEAVILALVVNRPIKESLAASLSANAISGFIGYVVFAAIKIRGVPILPIGPTAIAAILIETPIIALMLARPPIKRIVFGTIFANCLTLLLGLIVLSNVTLRPIGPTVSDDLQFSRALAQIRSAIDTYNEHTGHFPKYLTGGFTAFCLKEDIKGDPLIKSGLLMSYPENPYSKSLRSRRFTRKYMLFGLGPATIPVSFRNPSTGWEARWFSTIKNDHRFGIPEGSVLCANGLSDPSFCESFSSTFFNMNGRDYIPGCFFYRAYDFNRDGKADDYIFGGFGWPGSPGTVDTDLIDGATGEIILRLDNCGKIHPGRPDGRNECITGLFVAGARTNDI